MEKKVILMDTELLVKSIMGLIIILGVLITILFFLFPEEKKKKEKLKNSKNSTNKDLSLKALKKIVKNRVSSTDKLSEALDLIIKHHGVIPRKQAGTTHEEFDVYMDILFTICRHPNTNKNIIIKFDRALSSKNPTYKSSINDAITKGLESRRLP